MKTWAVYIIDRDGFGGEMRCTAKTENAALKKAKEYIKAWKLAPATIKYCKEVAAQ